VSICVISGFCTFEGNKLLTCSVDCFRPKRVLLFGFIGIMFPAILSFLTDSAEFLWQFHFVDYADYADYDDYCVFFENSENNGKFF
jgi:hypothetical protein